MLVHVVSLGECLILISREFLKSSLKSAESLVEILRAGRVPRLGSWTPRGGQPCLVLGNGPSLAQDIAQLIATRADYGAVFCVNQFAMSDWYREIRPSQYVLADPAYWQVDVATDQQREGRRVLQERLASDTTWPMQIWLPHHAAGSPVWTESRIVHHPHITIRFWSTIPVTGFRSFRCLVYRLGLGAPPVQNVLIGAIFIALQKHFSPVFILGADHSWHEELAVDDDNGVLVNQKHFYDSSTTAAKPVYRRTDVEIGIHDLFYALARAFEGYHLLAEYAESRGQAIINAGSKSYIDAFPRRRIHGS